MDTVLITGCSSGIGHTTALAFLEENWLVYATARNQDDISELNEQGCTTLELDVTIDSQVESVTEYVIDESGTIDCLVNNAGYGQFGPIEDVPVSEAIAQYNVNVHGPHRLIRSVLPQMRAQEDGTIINVSSNLGRFAIPTGGIYCGSKFALEAMSDALRVEVEKSGVDVVLIEPGPVETQFHNRVGKESIDSPHRTAAYSKLYRLFEDGRSVTANGPFSTHPTDVAEAIVNAASSTNPAPRYPVGPISKLSMSLRFLPDRWRDFAFTTALSLVR